MKFYDKGFITKYKNYVEVQVFNAGTLILNMKIYDDKVCRSSFKCQDLRSFNAQNLHSSYKDSFIKELFEKNEKNLVHRDKKNKILIKILRD